MTTLPHFLLEHKNSSDFFEICLPPEDPPWMKQAVVVSFEVFCFARLYVSLCLYVIDKKKLNKPEIALRHCKAPQCTKFFIEIGCLGTNNVV